MGIKRIRSHFALNTPARWVSNRIPFEPRTSFSYDPDLKWFPHHMAKAKVQIPKKLPTVDLVVEVRDARLPLTSAQFELDEIIRLRNGRHRIVVLNKRDLVSNSACRQAISLLELQGTAVLATSALNGTHVSSVVQFIKDNVDVKFKSLGLTVMLAGLPNTGKSTLLNSMRSFVDNPAVDKAPAKTSGLPGETQHISAIQISSHHPKIYVLDTPGVMLTKSVLAHEVNGDDTMMKLAAIGCIPETIPGIGLVADYILFTLNRLGILKYVEIFGLKSPSNDISVVIEAVAHHISDGSHRIDHHGATLRFIRLFREGRFGKVCLDSLPDVDQLLSDIERRKHYVFETEPPGPWGPESYPVDRLLERAIYKPHVR
jgi:ribosome biogenesis GTPase A